VEDTEQAVLLGGNARRFYGIDAKTFVTEPPDHIPRPAWFPEPDEIAAWWEREADPRGPGGVFRGQLWSRLTRGRVSASLIARFRSRS